MSQEPLESLLLIEQEIDRFPRAALNTCSGEDHGSVREALDTEGWPTLGEIAPDNVHCFEQR